MRHSCRCQCGGALELKHAYSRQLLGEYGNWAKWRLKFRCPRCQRAVAREFDCRWNSHDASPLETYEREALLEFGPIEDGEESGFTLPGSLRS